MQCMLPRCGGDVPQVGMKKRMKSLNRKTERKRKKDTGKGGEEKDRQKEDLDRRPKERRKR